MKDLHLYKRQLFNSAFKAVCYGSSLFSVLFLCLFLGVICLKSYNGLFATKIKIDLQVPQQSTIKERQIEQYNQFIYRSLNDGKIQIHRRDMSSIVSIDAPYQIYNFVEKHQTLTGKHITVWVTSSANVYKYFNTHLNPNLEENVEKLVKTMIAKNKIANFFNWQFFTNTDSSEPEMAGIGSSLLGSLMMVGICMCVAFPLGLITAIYLEEFAPKNFFTRLIEVNINNLSAVPSIVFGLLGLTLFVVFADLPRSSAIVGGLTLAILVLPIIVTTTRQALSTVPLSIKDAALALGASKLQIIFHHCLPIALPTVITGTILALSRALGETAPLILIGMAAFITNMPHSAFDPVSALPVQIYLWSNNPEVMFAEKASLAIVVLLSMLSIINFIAILIRKKYSVKL